MFDVNNNKDKKITVRFSQAEVQMMEKYMLENGIKSKTDLIRIAVGELIK